MSAFVSLSFGQSPRNSYYVWLVKANERSRDSLAGRDFVGCRGLCQPPSDITGGWAYLFSANGAASSPAWGNAPGILTASERALRARLTGPLLQSHITFVILDAVFGSGSPKTRRSRAASRNGDSWERDS
jgi:hypothetical protein